MITDKKIVAFFDFDSTLFATPVDTHENREILFRETGYKKSGWWGVSESLNMDVFDIPPVKYIVEKQREFSDDDDVYTIMLTGRILKLSTAVNKVIDYNNLVFDDRMFTVGGSTIKFKLSMLDKIKNECPNLEVIYFYDDRTKHIPKFRQWGDRCEEETGIKFRLFHVVGFDGSGTYELKYKQKLR